MTFAVTNAGVTDDAHEPPRLLDQIRRRLRVKHYSVRTEQAYVGWIRRFILANGKRHPRDMGRVGVERILMMRAVVAGDRRADPHGQVLTLEWPEAAVPANS